jgi:hypothetical protein
MAVGERRRRSRDVRRQVRGALTVDKKAKTPKKPKTSKPKATGAA